MFSSFYLFTIAFLFDANQVKTCISFKFLTVLIVIKNRKMREFCQLWSKRERLGGKYAKKEKEKKCKMCKRKVKEQTILEVVSLPCNVCENTFEINAKVRYECILRFVHNL